MSLLSFSLSLSFVFSLPRACFTASPTTMSSPPPQHAFPGSPTDEVRSPGSTTSAQQVQTPFIYPIKSAVSVKPSTSDTPPTPSRSSQLPGPSSVAGSEQNENQDAESNTFQLRNPTQGRFHRTPSSSFKGKGNPDEHPSQRGGAGSLKQADEENESVESLDSGSGSLAADDSVSEGANVAPPDASPGDFPYDEMRKMRLEGAQEPRPSPPSRQDASMHQTVGRGGGSDGRARMSTARTESVAVSESQRLESMMQPRFRHIETEQGHMVVTGRDGEISRCEDEVSL